MVSRKLLFHLDARGAQETKLLGLVSLPTAQSSKHYDAATFEELFG